MSVVLRMWNTSQRRGPSSAPLENWWNVSCNWWTQGTYVWPMSRGGGWLTLLMVERWVCWAFDKRMLEWFLEARIRMRIVRVRAESRNATWREELSSAERGGRVLPEALEWRSTRMHWPIPGEQQRSHLQSGESMVSGLLLKNLPKCFRSECICIKPWKAQWAYNSLSTLLVKTSGDTPVLHRESDPELTRSYLIWPLLTSIFIFSLLFCSSYSGCQTFLHTQQACSDLRAFALVFPTTGHALPQDLCFTVSLFIWISAPLSLI